MRTLSILLSLYATNFHIWKASNPKLNSLAPGGVGSNFKSVIWTHIMDEVYTSCEIALRWMPQNTFDDKSTLVQVMALCHQVTSHYLSQCWPWSMSAYGITRLQWVKWNRIVVISMEFLHCLRQKLSFWQLVVQSVMKISPKLLHFWFSILYGLYCLP